MDASTTEQTLKNILLTAREWHVIAHIGDDRLSEFLGRTHFATDTAGVVILSIDSTVPRDVALEFSHIRHQLVIELSPISTEPRMLRNFILRHSRIIGLPDDAENNVRGLFVVFDPANAYAIDAPRIAV